VPRNTSSCSHFDVSSRLKTGTPYARVTPLVTTPAFFRPAWSHRLAWPRTEPSQGSDTGSNPVGTTIPRLACAGAFLSNYRNCWRRIKPSSVLQFSYPALRLIRCVRLNRGGELHQCFVSARLVFGATETSWWHAIGQCRARCTNGPWRLNTEQGVAARLTIQPSRKPLALHRFFVADAGGEIPPAFPGMAPSFYFFSSGSDFFGGFCRTAGTLFRMALARASSGAASPARCVSRRRWA
jgi:hypothetical protein